MSTPTTAPKAKINWLSLEPKIKAVAAVAVALNGATLLAALSGTTSWRDALALVLATDGPAIAGYLKSST